MSLEILPIENIQIYDEVESWEEAIQIAAKPLLTKNIIEQSYINSMVRSVKDLGPYIVIAPEIAIAHARPDKDVHQVGLSLLKLNKHIQFYDEQHYATLIFVLSAIDNSSHLNILQSLANILSNKNIVQKLIKSNNKEEIIKIIKENE